MIENELPFFNIKNNSGGSGGTSGKQVTFQVDGQSYQVVSCKKGTSIDRILAPYRATQLCLGWYDETDTRVEFPYVPTKDTTLIAKYKDYGADCVFFEPFNKKSTTALTGQPIVYSNDKATIVDNGYAKSIDLANNDTTITINPISNTTGECTISTWMKVNGYTGKIAPLIGYSNETSDEIGIAIEYDSAIFGWNSYSSTSLSTDKYCFDLKHICLTAGQDVMKIYVNGELCIEKSASNRLKNNTLRFEFLKAYFSNVRLFNKALTEVEVQELASELE